MDLCARNGVVCNPCKFRFGRNEVDFAGFTVTDGRVKPTKKRWRRLQTFPNL